MSVRIDLNQKDLQELKKAFRNMRLRSTETVSKIIKGGAIVARNEAVVTAPKDTGRLKGSIRHVIESGGLEAWVYTNVDYAIYQNDGTSRIKGKRFMEKGHLKARKYIIKKLNNSNLGL